MELERIQLETLHSEESVADMMGEKYEPEAHAHQIMMPFAES
jgi:hypothetical protein